MLAKENLQATQYDLVFPNQEKEELSVFEITSVFCSLENKHFLCSCSQGDGMCLHAHVCYVWFCVFVGKGGGGREIEGAGRERERKIFLVVFGVHVNCLFCAGVRIYVS